MGLDINLFIKMLHNTHALLMKYTKYYEQVEEWGAKGVTMFYDGYIYIFTHV
jgi:hypothetical protein